MCSPDGTCRPRSRFGFGLVYCTIAQRRHHYEKAFEDYLRSKRIPYVAVDEAKKALLPEGASLSVTAAPNPALGDDTPRTSCLKSFDFVLYGQSNLLVEVKGRRIGRTRRPAKRGEGDASSATPAFAPEFQPYAAMRPPPRTRLDSWVTQDDIDSLKQWQSLFGPEFEAAFVFVYWCDEQPPDALFEEIFEHRGRWYAIRAVTLAAYTGAMKTRSPRWRTVHVPPSVFERISRPLAGASAGWTPDGQRVRAEVGDPVPTFATLGER